MKLLCALLLLTLSSLNGWAQVTNDSPALRKAVAKPALQKQDIQRPAQPDRDNIPVKRDSFQPLIQRSSIHRRNPVPLRLDSAGTTVQPIRNSVAVLDSMLQKDSARGKAIVPITKVSPVQHQFITWQFQKQLLAKNPYFNFMGASRSELTIGRPEWGKDGLFYLIVGVVFSFALVRLLFSKYLDNLFSVFFGVSLKQKQMREQLLQSPLPSLLLNFFFILSGGIYISFLMRYYNLIATSNLWFLMLYGTLALGSVYLVKFIILKMVGWIFNITEATDTYIFVVFLVNKLLGILLIPFLVLLAFSSPSWLPVLITLSFSMIVFFFSYRYILSYTPVRKEIKVSQFHFVLYLCAFEIMPLLLIYKVLLTLLERSS